MIIIICVLSVLCVALAVCFGVELGKRRKQKRDLHYAREKLEEIMKNQSAERVLFMTDDGGVRELLIAINELLDYNHANLVKYNKSENAMKKMLANISHDLKTPLTVIQGYLEMLQMRYPEDEAVEKAYARTQEVIKMMNEFFDVVKLESGDKELELGKLDLCEVCRLVIVELHQSIEEQDVEVEIQIPEKPIYVMGERDATRRILYNLITNALKYGGDGKFLGIKVEKTAQAAKVQVIDHGKGIKEQYKEEIFDRMFTLEDSRSKDYQGSGLGLTITKELVERMGGEIHVDSKAYEETVFSFTLPLLQY